MVGGCLFKESVNDAFLDTTGRLPLVCRLDGRLGQRAGARPPAISQAGKLPERLFAERQLLQPFIGRKVCRSQNWELPLRLQPERQLLPRE